MSKLTVEIPEGRLDIYDAFNQLLALFGQKPLEERKPRWRVVPREDGRYAIYDGRREDTEYWAWVYAGDTDLTPKQQQAALEDIVDLLNREYGWEVE